MKKFIKSKVFLFALTAIVVVAIIIQSCNKLNLQPLDKVSETAYYKTPADFDGAIFAAYSSLRRHHRLPGPELRRGRPQTGGRRNAGDGQMPHHGRPVG